MYFIKDYGDDVDGKVIGRATDLGEALSIAQEYEVTAPHKTDIIIWDKFGNRPLDAVRYGY